MTGETGSYRFMAPEVFRHEGYGRPVDVYSFSLIFYQIKIGEPPWPTKTGPDAVRLAANTGARPGLPRHWDARLQKLLKACWSADPALRPSFAAVLEVLNEAFKASVGDSYEEHIAKHGGSNGAGCCTIA